MSLTGVEEHAIGHYAFKIPQKDFEQVIQRLEEWEIDYWADPHKQWTSECYKEDGKKGLYFVDPSGHGIEILTNLE